jgi:hypothetical protein
MHRLLLRRGHPLEVECYVIIGRFDVHDGLAVVSVQETPEVSLLKGLGGLERLLWLLQTLESGQWFVDCRLN